MPRCRLRPQPVSSPLPGAARPPARSPASRPHRRGRGCVGTRSGSVARAPRSGRSKQLRHARRSSTAVVTLPDSSGRCSSHRVIAASAASSSRSRTGSSLPAPRARSRCARASSALSSCCAASDAPSHAARDHVAHPVGLRCAPNAPSQAPADRAPRPRMRPRLAARAPAACRPAPRRRERRSTRDRRGPPACASVTVRSGG